jgi:hypothetical protein
VRVFLSAEASCLANLGGWLQKEKKKRNMQKAALAAGVLIGIGLALKKAGN